MKGSIVAFCVRGVGHLHPLLPVVEGLSARGLTVHVLTDATFRPKIERCGARFVDLFTRYPIETLDPSSRPIPTRYVTFAAAYADRLIPEVAALDPALILYDTFSVVAPVVARSLGVPYVNVCANHAPVPAREIAALRDDPRVAISAQCWAAAERLREVHGMASANPFSYLEGMSPFLNLYPEPEEFLDGADRAALEPIVFFGAVAPNLHARNAPSMFSERRRWPRVYASFGTVIWRYYAEIAYAALNAVSAAVAEIDGDAVISLGGHDVGPEARTALARPNVRVVDYTDQWQVLGEADVFVTHHGINSTHESIFHQVPMMSYPFLGDQPALARRCQDLGLAVALAAEPRAPIEPAGVRAALARLADDADGFRTRLAEARSWELRTIAARDHAVERILALAKGSDER